MKKSWKMISLVVVACMAIALFAGCAAPAQPSQTAAQSSGSPSSVSLSPSASGVTPSSETPSSAAPAGEPIKIGVSLPTQREEIWVREKKFLEEMDKADPNVELLFQVADNDAGKQQSQCENLLSQGIKVLLVGPHDATAAGAIVETAHKAKVPVLSLDRLIMNSDIDLYVSFDNEFTGTLQGQYIVDNVPKGNMVLLEGDALDNNARLFYKGAMSKIQPKIDSGDYKVVMHQTVKDWQPNNAMQIVENALTANKNDIQGILAPNDGTAGGAVQALAAQGMAGKVPVSGQDFELPALKRIAQGTQGMTVFKDARDLCKTVYDAMVKMAKGEKVETTKTVNNGKIDAPSILVPGKAVTKQNLEEILANSGVYTKEDVFGK